MDSQSRLEHSAGMWAQAIASQRPLAAIALVGKIIWRSPSCRVPTAACTRTAFRPIPETSPPTCLGSIGPRSRAPARTRRKRARQTESRSPSPNSSGGPAGRAAFAKAASHRLTAFSSASAPWSTVSTIFSPADNAETSITAPQVRLTATPPSGHPLGVTKSAARCAF